MMVMMMDAPGLSSSLFELWRIHLQSLPPACAKAPSWSRKHVQTVHLKITITQVPAYLPLRVLQQPL